MKGIQWAAIVVAGFALSGCATIIEGTTQNVSVSTSPEQGAQCTLKNSEGAWYLTTPGSTTVHKTKNDMTIDCNKSGFAPGHLVAASHFGGTTAGNVIAGGVIGLGVDAASGANYHYDSPIVVALGAPDHPPTTTQTPLASAAPVQTASNAAPVATKPESMANTATSTPSPAASMPDASRHLDPHYPNYQPAYPDTAQVNGEQGDVVLKVRVNEDGRVRNVEVEKSSGFDDLDNAAVGGVLRWRYLPSDDSSQEHVTIAYRLPTAIIVPPRAASTQ